jgi:hypothetical protein
MGDAMEEKPLAACRPDFGSLACLLARLGGACRALDSRELGGDLKKQRSWAEFG